jgi:UDP-GlcNAc:undecaprenyl-phosphate/decaprenyl-phosphate GlcNAc-1-phosphate transferase
MLWVVSLVLFDIFTVTIRRVVRRRDPTKPDRAHLHHIVMRYGYSPRATTALIVTGNAAMGAIGTLAWWLGATEPALFATFIAIGLAYVGLFLYPARLLRRLRRRNNPGRVG